MTVTTWKSILKPFQIISTTFGMSMNSILVLLILYKSPKALGVYKFLMLYISVFELFFGYLELLAAPDIWSRDSAYSVITDPTTALLPGFLLQASNLIYCGSVALSLAIFSVQFFYRYQVFQGNTTWTNCRPRNMLCWMGPPLLFSAIWATLCVIFLSRDEYMDMLLINEILPTYYNNVSIDKIGVSSVYFFPKLENGEEVVNWHDVVGMSIMTSMLLSTETIMLFSGIKSYMFIKKLTETSTNSHLHRRVQWQLFWALVWQTLIPVFFMQLPASALFISVFFNSSSEEYGLVVSLTIPLYLATDALPTMFIVKAYRSTIFEYARCVKRGITSVMCKPPNNVGAHVPVVRTNAKINQIIVTLIPIVMSFTPCAVAWYSPALGIKLGTWIEYLCVITVAVFPVLDPLAIIFLLPNYRKKGNKIFSVCPLLFTNSTWQFKVNGPRRDLQWGQK